jgi:hypothetical protein
VSNNAFIRTSTIDDSTHKGTRRSDLRSNGNRNGFGATRQPISANIGPIPRHAKRG